jgi:hypothetical protein
MERESRVIIGCRTCEQKTKELRHTRGINDVIAFPTTTAYTRDELHQLEQGFTCPFCQDVLVMTPKVMKMIQSLFDGYAHIISRPDTTEILSVDTDCFIPHDRLYSSLDAFLSENGSHTKGLDPLVFKNPKEDLALIHEGMNDFDTRKWELIIESAGNPEPFAWDHSLWFSLFGFGDDTAGEIY